MITFGKTINPPLKNIKGFTLIEVMIVMAIIGFLATIAIPNFIPLRKKALDTMALTDARNLVDSVITAALNEENVDYNKIVPAGGEVGDKFTDTTPRPPVFILSPGVAAIITGDTIQPPPFGKATIFSARVYHTNGTTDLATGSGKKEYTCFIHETAGITILP